MGRKCTFSKSCLLNINNSTKGTKLIQSRSMILMIQLYLKCCWVFELKINTPAGIGVGRWVAWRGSVTVATKLVERPGGKYKLGVGKSSNLLYKVH